MGYGSNMARVNLWYPSLKLIHAHPHVFEVEQFFSAEECSQLIAAAQGPEMQPPAGSRGNQSDFEIPNGTSRVVKSRDFPSLPPKITSVGVLLLVV